MKTLVLISSVIFGLHSYSQNYTPFPDSNARWVNTTYTYVNNPPNPLPSVTFAGVNYFCMDANDTIIGTDNYSQITDCISTNYLGAVRDDGGRIFYVPDGSSTEYLVYDFLAQAGDTMTVYYEPYGSGMGETQQVTIQYTDSILVGNDYRKRVCVDNGCWIEGIGFESGWLREPWPNVSNYSTSLYCMSYNDTIYHHGGPYAGNYTSYDPGICDFDVGILPAPKDFIDFYPIPNPTRGEVSWYMDSAPENLTILNSNGQLIASSFAYNATKVELDLSSLSEGLYIIQFTFEEKAYQMRLLKE